MKVQEQDKAMVLIGLIIGGKYENDDFKIKMNESDVNQISEKYDAALKASGLDQEEFGPKFSSNLRYRPLLSQQQSRRPYMLHYKMACKVNLTQRINPNCRRLASRDPFRMRKAIGT